MLNVYYDVKFTARRGMVVKGKSGPGDMGYIVTADRPSEHPHLLLLP